MGFCKQETRKWVSWYQILWIVSNISTVPTVWHFINQIQTPSTPSSAKNYRSSSWQSACVNVWRLALLLPDQEDPPIQCLATWHLCRGVMGPIRLQIWAYLLVENHPLLDFDIWAIGYSPHFCCFKFSRCRSSKSIGFAMELCWLSMSDLKKGELFWDAEFHQAVTDVLETQSPDFSHHSRPLSQQH